jgi:DNA invertase Pin-like site-specific DNA recombinase
MAEGKFVSYLRVSTDKQGRSGLGLEAQRDAVARYLNGGRWKLLAEYVEVESGKRSGRPQLQAAISHATATGAKLVIARLDRLARNLHFVSSLQERGVDFVAADMPDANRLTIHIIAAVAEAVGRTISENTKTALAAAKARGVKLGNPYGARALRGKQVGNADAVAKLKADAIQRALDLAGIVNTLRSKGVTSVRSLADALNEQGIRAPRGDTWHPTAVSRLLKRLSAHGANAPGRTQAGGR